MSFEIQVRYTTPLTPVKDLDEVLPEFLTLIGYLSEGEGRGSIPYRLVRDCLLRNPERAWLPEELASVLKTTKPTVYRHLNRLKALDVIEEVPEPRAEHEAGKVRKAFRFRYGNLAKAWDFVEANTQNALKRYRETVDHVQRLVESTRRATPSGS